MQTACDEDAVARVSDYLYRTCRNLQLPKDHDWTHFARVASHTRKALEAWIIRPETIRTRFEATCLLLAALLHDVDDRKLQPWWSSLRKGPKAAKGFRTKFPVARSILLGCGCEAYLDLVMEIIGLVSTSTNGNSNNLPRGQKWKFIVREADRLEALGSVGIQRLFTGAERARMPFRTSSTVLPRTNDEINRVLCNRPLSGYVASGGYSASFLDHFYDKLLHLDVVHSQNPYLAKRMKQRVGYMRKWLIHVNQGLHCADVLMC